MAIEGSTITESKIVGSFNNSGESRVTEYRRKRDTGTWHWSTRCSAWPKIDYFVNQSMPGQMRGELCGECDRVEDAVAQQENLTDVK